MPIPPISDASALACLTLLLPASAEARVVDWLLSRPGEAVEFSVHAVAARGPLVQLSGGEEAVRGYAQRVEVKLIARRPAIAELADEAAALLAGTPGGYWVLPVERFAAFAPAHPARPVQRVDPVHPAAAAGGHA